MNGEYIKKNIDNIQKENKEIGDINSEIMLKINKYNTMINQLNYLIDQSIKYNYIIIKNLK
jgi:hypothetical protein